MFFSIVVLSLIGITVSCYAWYVENRIKHEIKYKPACDISDHISCSKPLQSPYANLFYISNSVAGILFYVLSAVFGSAEYTRALLVITSGALLMTLYLTYILFFKIRSICPLCVTLYCVNVLLWIASLYLYLK